MEKSQKQKTQTSPAPHNDKVFPDVMGPAGFLVLLWAVFLDLFGAIIFVLDFFTAGLAEIIGIIPDLLGVSTLGVQDWRKSDNIPFGPKLKKFFMKRSGARFLLEFIPTGFLPLWTIYVYKKSKQFSTSSVLNEEAYAE